MKKIFILVMIFAIFLFLISCKKRLDFIDDKNIDYKICIMTDGAGIHDQGFNQSAWQALDKFGKNHKNVKVNYIENRMDSDYFNSINLLTNYDYDIIIGVGFPIADAIRYGATENPNTKFIIIDDASIDLPNVIDINFKEEQGGYLAGVVAGMMTKTKKVGMIMGMNIIPVVAYGIGFIQGVHSVDDNIQVIINNANSFSDSALGASYANSMITNGVDIIFDAAGGSGLGAINCCIENDTYVISCDTDKSYLAPENILTSALKNVEQKLYDVLEMCINDDFVSGVYYYGIEDNGIDIITENKLLPKEVVQKVEEAKEKINNGEVNIKRNKEDFPEWKY